MRERDIETAKNSFYMVIDNGVVWRFRRNKDSITFTSHDLKIKYFPGSKRVYLSNRLVTIFPTLRSSSNVIPSELGIASEVLLNMIPVVYTGRVFKYKLRSEVDLLQNLGKPNESSLYDAVCRFVVSCEDMRISRECDISRLACVANDIMHLESSEDLLQYDKKIRVAKGLVFLLKSKRRAIDSFLELQSMKFSCFKT